MVKCDRDKSIPSESKLEKDFDPIQSIMLFKNECI